MDMAARPISHNAAELPAPSQQSLLQSSYGIIRSRDKRKGSVSWLVRLRRDGSHVGTRYFYDHHYDSPDAALAAAVAYRDAILKQHPPLSSREHRQRINERNTSGVAGVSRDRGRTGYWMASTRLADGTVLLKRFSVKTHGETAAKELAVLERERQLQHVHNLKLIDPDASHLFHEQGAATGRALHVCTFAPKSNKPTLRNSPQSEKPAAPARKRRQKLPALPAPAA